MAESIKPARPASLSLKVPPALLSKVKLFTLMTWPPLEMPLLKVPWHTAQLVLNMAAPAGSPELEDELLELLEPLEEELLLVSSPPQAVNNIKNSPVTVAR